MIKRFLFLLILLTFNFVVKCSENKEAETKIRENMGISGSKRSNEGAMVKRRQKEFEQGIIESLRQTVINLNDKRQVDYSNDPAMNFFDKFMKISVEAKLSETCESLWEMSFITSLSVDWHTTAFFLLLNSGFKISEHVFIEYFKYICPFWSYETFKAAALIQAMKSSITKLFSDLFEEILKEVDKEKVPNFGTETLILLQKMSEVTGLKETTKWRVMCTLTVKKFPESVYESKLRIDDFKGEELVKKTVFIHLLPILRNLMIETMEEFVGEQDYFDLFALFQLGDLDAKLPMGVGGLLLINQMFLRSKINLSAFKLELNTLKQDIIERIFDVLFLGLEAHEMVKIFFDNSTFSIFESFLKYSKNLKLSEQFLYEALQIFIEKATFYYEFNFIYALLAYVNIPRTVWTRLTETFQGQLNKIFIINQCEALDVSIKRYESCLDLKSREVFVIEFDGEMVDRMAEIKKRPLQLEVARLFLARVCGIPLEMTDTPDNANENFEWSEAVAFINFYVERTARIFGYSSEEDFIIKFQVV